MKTTKLLFSFHLAMAIFCASSISSAQTQRGTEFLERLEGIPQYLQVVEASSDMREIYVESSGHQGSRRSRVGEASSLCNSATVRKVNRDSYQVCLENLYDVDNFKGKRCFTMPRRTTIQAGPRPGSKASNKEKATMSSIESRDLFFSGYYPWIKTESGTVRTAAGGKEIRVSIEAENGRMTRLEVKTRSLTDGFFLGINFIRTWADDVLICEE